MRADPRFERHDGQADGWWAIRRAISRPGPTSWPVRCYAAGARPGDVIHNAYGYGLFTGGLGAHYTAQSAWAARSCRCRVALASARFQLIREFGARVVLMTPSYMLAIADEFERQGVDPRDTAMRLGLFRRRALDRGHARGDRAPARDRCHRPLWPE